MDAFDWDDVEGDWAIEDIEEWHENVTMLLEEDPDHLDRELEELYRSVETHFDAHNELAQQEEYAEAFYELEAAYDDKISFDMIMKGLNKESIGDGYEFNYSDE